MRAALITDTDVALADVALADVALGPPVELREFEKEVSRPLLLLRMDHDAADTEDTITNALIKRGCCNPIQIHLRVKKGFRPDAALSRSELDELSSLCFSNTLPARTKCNALAARKLAQFYVQIATIRARIMEELQHLNGLPQGQPSISMTGRLQRAHATQIQTMQTKQRENREQLDRIMRTLILDPESDHPCVHPDITEADLDTLELQVQDIAERGCASNHLCCVKIQEAAVEKQRYDELMSELDRINGANGAV